MLRGLSAASFRNYYSKKALILEEFTKKGPPQTFDHRSRVQFLRHCSDTAYSTDTQLAVKTTSCYQIPARVLEVAARSLLTF